MATSAVYAAFDELHQHFAEGRGPRVSDVLLDTAGALTGALAMTVTIFLIGCALRRREAAVPET